MRPEFSYFKENGTNDEWAKEVRARLADLNELLDQAPSRDVIVTGDVAMVASIQVEWQGIPPKKTINLNLSQRI